MTPGIILIPDSLWLSQGAECWRVIDMPCAGCLQRREYLRKKRKAAVKAARAAKAAAVSRAKALIAKGGAEQ